jgi:hypothetical protein
LHRVKGWVCSVNSTGLRGNQEWAHQPSKQEEDDECDHADAEPIEQRFPDQADQHRQRDEEHDQNASRRRVQLLRSDKVVFSKREGVAHRASTG